LSRTYVTPGSLWVCPRLGLDEIVVALANVGDDPCDISYERIKTGRKHQVWVVRFVDPTTLRPMMDISRVAPPLAHHVIGGKVFALKRGGVSKNDGMMPYDQECVTLFKAARDRQTCVCSNKKDLRALLALKAASKDTKMSDKHLWRIAMRMFEGEDVPKDKLREAARRMLDAAREYASDYMYIRRSSCVNQIEK